MIQSGFLSQLELIHISEFVFNFDSFGVFEAIMLENTLLIIIVKI